MLYIIYLTDSRQALHMFGKLKICFLRFIYYICFLFKQYSYVQIVTFTIACEVMAKSSHKHYLYILGLQPKLVIEDAPYSPFNACPQVFTVVEANKFGKFYRITGTKHFCTYILVYDKCNIKPASDPKLRFARVVMAFPLSNCNMCKIHSSQF